MRIAAIDLGSNSFHMLVANIVGSSFETLLRERMTIQIGRDAFVSGRLDSESIERGMRCIDEFRRLALARQVERTFAVATSAVREAENGEDFIHRIRSEAGIAVRAISGREEARLIYLAVRQNIDLRNKNVLLVDIGGGSVELTVADAGRIHFCTSQKLGFLRLHGQFVSSDPMTEAERRSLISHFESALSAPLAAVRKYKPEMIIATSGMATTLLRVVQRRYPELERSTRVSKEHLSSILEISLGLKSLQRANKLDLDLARSEYFPTALLCLNAVLEGVHATEFLISPYSLREGLVYDFIARNEPEARNRESRGCGEPGYQAVLDLAVKCDYPPEHSEKVAQLAGQIFDQTRDLHGFGEAEARLLRYAGILHDIGYHIAYEKHHKHGAYLIMNSELRAFTPHERELLAQLVRYHRGAKPKRTHPQFAVLSKKSREKIKCLSAILRIADSLDRSHSQVIEEVRCSRNLNTIHFRLFTTARSVDVDLDLQAARRNARYFEKLFGCNTLFQASQSKDVESPAAADILRGNVKSGALEKTGSIELQNSEEIA